MRRGARRSFFSRWGSFNPPREAWASTKCSMPLRSPTSPRSSRPWATCSTCSPSAIAAKNRVATPKKMNPTIALPSPSRNRFADFLSSATRPRAKRKRDAMEQPRSDEDQQLVARTQAGEAAAFDELVVKYTPRLYGLVYNMTSNHEDTNDLLQDIFSKAYKSIGGVPGRTTLFNSMPSIAANKTPASLKKRAPPFFLRLPRLDASV